MIHYFAAIAAVFCALSQAGVSASEHKMVLDELAQISGYKRKTEKTFFFAQAQLKYGLNPNSGSGTYARGRWLDRPLFIDPKPAGKHKAPLETWDFLELVNNAKKYQLDGFSFFPDASTRFHYFDYIQEANVQNFLFLPKLTHFKNGSLEKKKQVLEKALACTQVFRLDGKVVIETYGANADNLTEWREFIDEIRKEYPNQFLFVMKPSLSLRALSERYYSGKIRRDSVASLRASLIPYLRIFDGLVVAGYEGVLRNGMRVADTDFFRDFFSPVLKALYHEEEFQNKLLGIQCSAGHANANRIGYSRSHEGTETLRKTTLSALNANADFLFVTEWDEQDENTAIRPTVYNSTAYLRIVRYLAARNSLREQEPLPGDDLSKPNLIVSYRKSLTLGEECTVEVLNVPDTAEGHPFSCQVFFTDIDGNQVWEFPAVQFNSGEFTAHRLKLASEKLAQYRCLLPGLRVTAQDRQTIYQEGFHYIALHATWNWDYVWVKQPLREIFKPVTVNLGISKDADESVTVTANAQAESKLHFAELLDNDNVVFAAGSEDAVTNWRENNKQYTVLFRMDTIKSRVVSGSISIEGADGTIGIYRRNTLEVFDNILVFDKWHLSSWSQAVYLNIPRQDAAKALIHVDFSGIMQKKISFCDILAQQVFCFAGTQGSMFSLHRFTGQEAYPPRGQAQNLKFTAKLLPDNRHSMVHLRLQNEAGQLYFSKPLFLVASQLQGKAEIRVFSNSLGKPVTLSIDRNRLFDCTYRIAPEQNGDAFLCDYGRSMRAVGGMSIANVTLRGDQEGANNGMPLVQHMPRDYDKTAPELVKDERDEWAWLFDGKDDFITFPVGFIPRMAAFTLSFKIKPEDTQQKQFILGNRAHYPGSLSQVCIEQGKLKAAYININETTREVACNLTIPVHVWSEVKIIYDLENLFFEINGERSEKMPCPGPGIYDMVSCFGGHQFGWFAGLIKDIHMKHSAIP